MLNAVELTNFKNIRNQRIDLERLTVFVGANSSGKTSVLDGIHLAVRAATPKRPEQELKPWEPRPDRLFR